MICKEVLNSEERGNLSLAHETSSRSMSETGWRNLYVSMRGRPFRNLGVFLFVWEMDRVSSYNLRKRIRQSRLRCVSWYGFEAIDLFLVEGKR